MNKLGLIVGIILGIIGLYKIDTVLIAGLNYFGKYVFFGLFHLFLVYLYYWCYKKKWYLPIILGIVILITGLAIG